LTGGKISVGTRKANLRKNERNLVFRIAKQDLGKDRRQRKEEEGARKKGRLHREG